jgi:NAD(P)H-hydrate repair Nnr-like enzyme with NAD(P)H-hydrate epimerase domain
VLSTLGISVNGARLENYEKQVRQFNAESPKLIVVDIVSPLLRSTDIVDVEVQKQTGSPSV